jgi:hypothetical protein
MRHRARLPHHQIVACSLSSHREEADMKSGPGTRFQFCRDAAILASGALLLLIASAVSAQTAPAPNPERNAYFGELHIHSSWSIDSYVFGTRIGPEDATKYAMGLPVTHPGGFRVQLKHPLDFTVVMDHSEYTGALAMADDPNSPLRKNNSVVANLLRFGTWANGMDLYKILSVSVVLDKPIKVLQGPEVAGYAWRQIVRIADRYNHPGRFTTFPGWEWTSTPDYKNLHRIVFFKDGAHTSQTEFSSLNSTDPRQLWKWMAEQRGAGNDVIAISHNGNLSNGTLYPRRVDYLGRPVDKTYAQTRMFNEPVSEIDQVKGQSETTPFLSPEDRFADFNIFVWLLLGAKGVPTDYGSYMRLALRDGIAMQGALGFNPYKFGFVAGSDSHSAASAYRQDKYFGEHGTLDDTVQKRLSPVKHLNMDNRKVCTAGLTGVWAEQNTRNSIWSAIEHKETFATSGLRMKVRLFGGWNYSPKTFKQQDWVKVGYAKGVPMGSDLPAPTSKAPTLIVWAQSDPTGPNLDRIQIVKGWAENGQSFEKIYDVAWAGNRKPNPLTGQVPPVGSTVDISKGTYKNTIGSTELETVWTDPDFNPSLDAFYYARVLLIPWSRWTTIQAAQIGVVPPSVVPLTVQDRAWSSPIWYTPSAQARKTAKPGMTVAELEHRGAVALNDAQLKNLIVGKTVRIHNTVTGHRFDILYGADGKRLVTAIDGKTPDPAQTGDLVFDPETEYKIQGGQISAFVNGTRFDAAVYKLGDKYFAARNDEYGFANYKVDVARH